MTNIEAFQHSESNLNTVSSILSAAVRSPGPSVFGTAYLMAMRGTLAAPVLDATDFYEAEVYQDYLNDHNHDMEHFTGMLVSAYADIENPSKFPITYVEVKLLTDPFRVALPRYLAATPATLGLATAGYYLQDLAGESSWYLSTRTASVFTGLSKSQNAVILNNLLRFNILCKTQIHTRTSATRYRYLHPKG